MEGQDHDDLTMQDRQRSGKEIGIVQFQSNRGVWGTSDRVQIDMSHGASVHQDLEGGIEARDVSEREAVLNPETSGARVEVAHHDVAVAPLHLVAGRLSGPICTQNAVRAEIAVGGFVTEVAPIAPDLSAIWFFILLGIAAEPVFNLPRRRAKLATVTFAVIYILVMSWTGRSSASRAVDPYEDWLRVEAGSVVLHVSAGAEAATIEDIAGACERSAERVEELTMTTTGAGAPGMGESGRIDCYLYPSLEEKLRVTDNPAIAHRVERAGAVHVAWVGGSEAALTREMFKLVSAQAQGTVYTPLIRDGLAVYAGRTWSGRPVREEGADLLERRVLPDLDMLVDAAVFVRLDERLSQPAAGSLMDFLSHEKGTGVLRGLYADSAGRSDVAGALLESAFGDSLDAVEERWLEYLESATDTLGTCPSDAE